VAGVHRPGHRRCGGGVELHQVGAPLPLADPLDHLFRDLQLRAHRVQRLVHLAGVLRAVGRRRHFTHTVTSGALRLERFWRRQPAGNRVVAGRTGWSIFGAALEELVVPALLEREERPDVAAAAGRRQVRPVHRASPVARIEDAVVREERLEDAGVAAVAPFAADVVARMGRALPVEQVLGVRWIDLCVMAVGAATRGLGSSAGSKGEESSRDADGHLEEAAHGRPSTPPSTATPVPLVWRGKIGWSLWR
jgi:hypothetical protein